MLCLGLAAGIPQVCLPQHLEQLYMARQAEARGAARVIWPQTAPAEAIRAALVSAWHDSAARTAAQELAGQLAPDFVRDDGPVLRKAIARWLDTKAP
jgi:UDP:flavonoid glycosyltransferase YjiC (YdhE family)